MFGIAVKYKNKIGIRSKKSGTYPSGNVFLIRKFRKIMMSQYSRGENSKEGEAADFEGNHVDTTMQSAITGGGGSLKTATHVPYIVYR